MSRYTGPTPPTESGDSMVESNGPENPSETSLSSSDMGFEELTTQDQEEEMSGSQVFRDGSVPDLWCGLTNREIEEGAGCTYLSPLPESEEDMLSLGTEMNEDLDKINQNVSSGTELGEKSESAELLDSSVTVFNQCQKGMSNKDKLAKMVAQNKALREKSSRLEYESGKRLLELTLQLQEKITKIEMYEQMHGVMVVAPPVGVSTSGGQILPPWQGMAAMTQHDLNARLQQALELVNNLKEERKRFEKRAEEATKRYRALETKYNKLLVDLSIQKTEGKGELTEVKSALQFKKFEVDRLDLLLTESEMKYKNSEKENTRLKNKLESARYETNELKSSLEGEVTRLTIELDTKSTNLRMYEQLEDSIDEIIVNAASFADPEFPAIFEDTLPTNSKRRLQQSFGLAKRVFEQEKTIEELKEELLSMYDQRESLRGELEMYKTSNSQSVTNLITAVWVKQEEILILHQKLSALEKEVGNMKATNSTLETSLKNAREYNQQVIELHRARSSVYVTSPPPERETESLDPSTSELALATSVPLQPRRSSTCALVVQAPSRTSSSTRNFELKHIDRRKFVDSMKQAHRDGSLASVDTSDQQRSSVLGSIAPPPTRILLPSGRKLTVSASAEHATKPLALQKRKIKPTRSMEF